MADQVNNNNVKANNNNAHVNAPVNRTLRDYFRLVMNDIYSSIQRQQVNAKNFELESALVNMVQQNQYSGLAHEVPNIHLATFLEICDTIKINGVMADTIRLKLFSFSLRDRARPWFQSIPPINVNTWEDMAQKFLTKFFPPSITSQLRAEITKFRQMESGQLYEAWDRFKEMLKKFPQLGIEDWFQVQLFYNGLNGPTISHIDVASGGTSLSKTPTKALIIFEDMAINSCQWKSERLTVKKAVGVFEVDQIMSLVAQMSALTNQIKGLTENKVAASQEIVNVTQASSSNGLVDEKYQYVNQNYNFRPNNNLPTYYHSGLLNHETNFYANNRNVLQPPQDPTKQIGEKPSQSLEDLLKTYIMEARST
ncbi:uncharacterized protein LOC133805656 [Humulus lupulus]|uniref:uncharacterized protein LOC133805656 n=1 Tax=Humulus lupulus TaxID=3486 RepID=UPI002B40EFFF|nr:uncharacterized protein LOC133805656 [Humulus lupulus]